MADGPIGDLGLPFGLQMELTQFAMDNASIEIYWLGRDARIHYANNYACSLLGYTKNEMLALSVPDLDPNYPIERWAEHWRDMECVKTRTIETLHKRKDGLLVPVEVVANYVSVDSHEYIVGFASDITGRKLAERVIREKEEFFRMISENVEDFIVVLDLDGRRLYNNSPYTRFFGDLEALKGSDSFQEIHPDDRERIRELFHDTVNSGVGHRAEFRFILPNGRVRWMESGGALIKNAQGEPLRVLVVSHDITERKLAESRFHELAFHDSLTKLPNRRLARDRLEQTMAHSHRNNRYSALMFLDLDNFKPLNDKYGHEAGDQLLIEVSARLRNCVREMDTVARFGGDEFMVLLNELDTDESRSVSEAQLVAEKIRAALAEPYLIPVCCEHDGQAMIEHQCTSSIGVAMFIDHCNSAEEIIRRADQSMYRSKQAGRNQVQFYDGREG